MIDPTLLPALDAIERALEPRKPRLRIYTPHPCAPRVSEEEAAQLDGRSFEQWSEGEMGYHGSDRR